jgi:hypothetical protein
MPPRAVAILATYAILGNLAWFSVRRFIRKHGGKVSWLDKSFALAAERRYLQKLSGSRDAALARRARRYHQLAVLLVWSFVPFVVLMAWATSPQ